MKSALFSLLITLTLGPAAFSQGFYDVDSVRTIEIIFAQSNWDYLLDSLYARDLDERLMGTVIIDGVQFDSVGIRYKGFSTYNPNRVKNPFNIKLDYIIEDQELEGYGTLKLANVWADPSFVREVLSYDIARKYMPACLANYANVYVNGTLIGLYVSVQDVDKYFMRTHFSGSDEGARFKGETNGSPGQLITIWGYFGQNSSSYENYYKLESDEGWDELIDFLDTLNNYTAVVESVLNVDRHLWMIAYDNLLVNLDAPINFAHNYYLYRDNSRRFNPIVWDLNMSFGGFGQIIGGSVLNTTQMQQLTPFLNQSNSYYPIINKFLSNASYKKKYVAHMKTIMAENFANGWYQTRALELQSIIAQHVQNDPNKFYSYTQFINNIASSVGSTPGIVQLMAARINYLNGLADFMATAPTIANVDHTPTSVPSGSTATVTATVTNGTTVTLAYRDIANMPFVKITMFDDGGHGDGAAGDGVYGATVIAGARDIQYYIYAENTSAGAFMPVRAEFEYYTIDVTAHTGTGVVINEFMADNDAVQQDPAGEYDDWIELYNPTTSAIPLNGCYLSDNAAIPDKWMFPDVTIEAGGYLIVWADEGEGQEGLHASFKLSKSGEAIVLSNPELAVIDQVAFGAQTTNISTGRCPNGSGTFDVMATPTFGAANDCPAINYEVVINEFMADNGTYQQDPAGEYEDWIELYNPSTTTAVPLAGCYLSDDPATPNKWMFPDVTIEAGGYLVIWADEDDGQEGVHAGFKLSKSGEAVILSDPELNVIEQVSFGAQATDVSTGRCPNGTGSFVATASPTIAAVNDCPTVNYGVVINEFMADNDAYQTDPAGEYEDWIELYNPTASAISLVGCFLSDNASLPTKWTFPEVTIEAGGYLVIWADEDDGQEGLHAAFKLSKSGEAVVLSDPEQVVIDQVTFGAQTTNVSTGRCPNGTGAFVVTNTPTIGAVNDCPGNCCVIWGHPGDANADSAVNLLDILLQISYVYDDDFIGPANSLRCDDLLDANGDGNINLLDILYLISNVYDTPSGPAPVCPE